MEILKLIIKIAPILLLTLWTLLSFYKYLEVIKHCMKEHNMTFMGAADYVYNYFDHLGSRDRKVFEFNLSSYFIYNY